MNCPQYIFHLTSGQAQDAGLWPRWQAAQHRLICSRCRAFTRNDARLSSILRAYADHQTGPDHPPGGPEVPPTAP